jgi:hypothetical protein
MRKSGSKLPHSNRDRGDGCPSSPPTQPDMRVRIRRSGGLNLTMSRELGKSERGEVSVRQSEFERWSVCEVPRSIGAAGGLRGFLRSDAALAELSIVI